MEKLILHIGNKNYSSWSLRPWMVMTAFGIEFEERLIPFDFAKGNPAIKAISPSGRVPLLQHGELKIWESLAIVEYIAELSPDLEIWPQAPADRAVARAISTEMVAGFVPLRSACPMNIRRPKRAIAVGEGVLANVTRISTIWRERLERSGGPFLFGSFTAADAMFAPVVNRFDTYDLTDDDVVLGYISIMKNHPAWRKWEEAARAESWIVEDEEV